MEAWVGGVDRWLGAWATDVEADGGARTRRWGLGRSAMGLGVGRWNKSAVRELAGELRDEGDEGGQRAREEKKMEEERTKKRSQREREREKKGKEYFNERGERSVIKNIYIYILVLNYNAHLKINVHFS